MLIRRATTHEHPVARVVHQQAFGHDDEAVDVFERLVADGDVLEALTFVAVVDDMIVGNVVASPATVAEHPVVAVGPVGVLPHHQGRGIGSAMMHALLGAADALDHPLVALLGSTDYYARFGFVAAASVGIEAPPSVPADDFQIRVLTAYRPELTGPFRYVPAFDPR